jgi:hypothetical protein
MNKSVGEIEVGESHPAVRGSGVIFYIKQTKQFMFYLRDDKDTIPCPNMISLIGGHVDPGETVEETVTRELAEELDDLDTGRPFQPSNITHFRTYIDIRGVEQNIFGCILDTMPNLKLNEGQRLVFLAKDELASTTFAFEFSQVIQDFAQTV